MDDCKIILNTGLRGVKIAQTRISDVDGDAGRLIYRGYLIQELASRATFEEVAYLLLFEKLPSQTELLDFKGQLSREREVPADLIAALKTRPAKAMAMDVLQAAVSMLANHDPELPQVCAGCLRPHGRSPDCQNSHPCRRLAPDSKRSGTCSARSRAGSCSQFFVYAEKGNP